MQPVNSEALHTIQMKNNPVKVIQFGTGMLLRGLIDEVIHTANERNLFHGKVAVVKSLRGDGKNYFAEQQYQYTVFVSGFVNKEHVHSHHINHSIAYVWQAENDWLHIQQQFIQPSVEFIISNTTEAGLVYEEENILQGVPHTYPAKLTALLYHRFKQLPLADLFIIPTELIENNGNVLKAHVLHHAKVNRLPVAFYEWLNEKIHFCNSLVDRIVTKASAELVAQLNYTDALAIQTEPYYLWAIECEKKFHQHFQFAAGNENVIVAEDISYYRERKLRLLNGLHTFAACKGYLTYSNTVYEMMENAQMRLFIDELLDEMIPAMRPHYQNHLQDFAATVLQRFFNPHLKHSLLDICFECTAKMKYRNIPLLKQWYEVKRNVPNAMAEGFAWYILFMKSAVENGKYWGRRNGDKYLINDSVADLYYYLWKDFDTKYDMQRLVFHVCKNEALWGTDLTSFPGFADAVAEQLIHIASNIGIE
jgi:tagaturonate reductase